MSMLSQSEGMRSAFSRLAHLLDSLPPPHGVAPIAMHLGEIQAPPPEFVGVPLAELTGWAQYPPLGGTDSLRAAYRHWLERRFDVPLASSLVVEPTAGAKQALAYSIAAAVRRHAGGKSAVAMPEPFYPTYFAATLEAGATPRYYTPEPGQVLESLRRQIECTDVPLAAVVLCHPTSPGGEVYSMSTLGEIARLAQAAGAWLIVDECYVDSYIERAPPSYLSAVVHEDAPLNGVLVLHTLSKRSAMPGLRSGFVVGDAEIVERIAQWNRSCGVSLARPLCDAAAQLWSDDSHAAAIRARISHNWRIAERELKGLPGYRRPDAGFYLWWPVANEEQATQRLWTESALKVMPGSYFTAKPLTSKGHLRLALVHDPETTRVALARFRQFIAGEK